MKVAEMKVKQVIPADGWRAALVRLDFENGPELYEAELVCWAVLDDGSGAGDIHGHVVAPGSNCVVPCTSVFHETEETDEPTQFAGYLPPSKSAVVHKEWARELYDRWRRDEEEDLELLDAGWHITGGASRPRYTSPDGREYRRKHEALEAMRGAPA